MEIREYRNYNKDEILRFYEMLKIGVVHPDEGRVI